jgi:hypothetical protein
MMGNRTIASFEGSQAMPNRLFVEAVGSESGKPMGSVFFRSRKQNLKWPLFCSIEIFILTFGGGGGIRVKL